MYKQHVIVNDDVTKLFADFTSGCVAVESSLFHLDCWWGQAELFSLHIGTGFRADAGVRGGGSGGELDQVAVDFFGLEALDDELESDLTILRDWQTLDISLDLCFPALEHP